MRLADEVEEIFVKYFAEDDKRKAMKYLKPTQRKESHAVTFFIGNFFFFFSLKATKVNVCNFHILDQICYDIHNQV